MVEQEYADPERAYITSSGSIIYILPTDIAGEPLKHMYSRWRVFLLRGRNSLTEKNEQKVVGNMRREMRETDFT